MTDESVKRYPSKSSSEMTRSDSSKTLVTDMPDVGVKFSGSKKDGQVISHLEDALSKVFGTEDSELAASLTGHCLKVLSDAESGDGPEGNDERAFMMSIVADIAPKDAIERMMAVQMAATHVAAIRLASWFAQSQNQMQFDGRGNSFNKLARTFAAQVETLRKHRNGGKQTVTVQHVNVEDGGQAIVGNVETGGGKK